MEKILDRATLIALKFSDETEVEVNTRNTYRLKAFLRRESADQRIESMFHLLAAKVGKDKGPTKVLVEADLSHQEIGDYCGISRQTVGEYFRHLGSPIDQLGRKIFQVNSKI